MAEIKHPGVVLLKRIYSSGEEGWRARWTDPDTGRVEYQTLDGGELKLTSDRKRRQWAKKLSDKLADRKGELRAGVRKIEEISITKAVEDYFKRKEAECRATTITRNKAATSFLEKWAVKHGVKITADLTPPVLAQFRADVISRPKKQPVKGAKRGKWDRSDAKPSAGTINRDLQAIRNLLNDLRRLGQTPHLDSDAITDGLRAMKAPRQVPAFLRTPDIRKLLQAARRHDTATFACTREENAAGGKPGSTLRHEPITPFLTTVLLSGMRFGEASGLRWSEVDTDAGEIVLDADRVKTGMGRRIPLDVTPALKATLAELKLKAGRSRFVFGGDAPISRDWVETCRRRLMRDYGAPKFSWQDLRRTCGTFITCSSVHGAAGAFLSAKRLGHSVMVSEKHYAGAVTDIPADADTIEKAMGIADLLPAPKGKQSSRKASPA